MAEEAQKTTVFLKDTETPLGALPSDTDASEQSRRPFIIDCGTLRISFCYTRTIGNSIHSVETEWCGLVREIVLDCVRIRSASVRRSNLAPNP